MENQEITGLLAAWKDGDREAEALLMEIVRDKLRGMIRHNLKREENRRLTLQTTEMLHELYIRLVGEAGRVDWQSRGHFYGIVARLIRHLAVDAARHKGASKRSALHAVSFDLSMLPDQTRQLDMLELDQALDALEAIDPQKAQLVQLRYFAGLTVEETADCLGVSAPTVKRMWRFTKAWLFDRLGRNPAPADDEPTA